MVVAGDAQALERLKERVATFTDIQNQKLKLQKSKIKMLEVLVKKEVHITLIGQTV